MEPMWHPSWEPFWKTVDEVQLPLHFHTFPTTPPRARQEAPNVRRAAMFTGVSAFQMGLIHIIAGMMRGRHAPPPESAFRGVGRAQDQRAQGAHGKKHW
jgi:hypothetical protein